MSDHRLRLGTIVLAALGIMVAGYLTYVHYADIAPVCTGGSGGCERVQSSTWADLIGVPVALLGLITYLAIAGAALPRSEPAQLAVTALALIGAGFSLYLTYVEIFELRAICQWCVVSAVIMVGLALISITRLLRLQEAA